MITFYSHYVSPCMTAPVTGPSAVPMTGIMTGPMTGLITGPMTGPVTGPMKGLMTKNRTHKMWLKLSLKILAGHKISNMETKHIHKWILNNADIKTKYLSLFTSFLMVFMQPHSIWY